MGSLEGNVMLAFDISLKLHLYLEFIYAIIPHANSRATYYRPVYWVLKRGVWAYTLCREFWNHFLKIAQLKNIISQRTMLFKPPPPHLRTGMNFKHKSNIIINKYICGYFFEQLVASQKSCALLFVSLTSRYGHNIIS